MESLVPAPGVGIHPDLPNTLVHFTGRPRASGDEPPTFVDGRLGGDHIQKIAKAVAQLKARYAKDDAEIGAEQRLISVLVMGSLMGAPVHGTSQPVICFSECSEEARRVMLRDGVVPSRGPYAPWGLLLHREALINCGVRPVLYLSSDEMVVTSDLPLKLRNRRVRYDPGTADWLHEREWRLCFDTDEQPELPITSDLVAGIIVGRAGWQPPVITTRETIRLSSGRMVEVVRSTRSAHGLPRWWWNGKDLVEDGNIDLGDPNDEANQHPGLQIWL